MLILPKRSLRKQSTKICLVSPINTKVKRVIEVGSQVMNQIRKVITTSNSHEAVAKMA